MSLHTQAEYVPATGMVLPAMLGRTCVRLPRSRATRNTGYHWTPGEIRLLQRLVGDGMAPRLIARQLGRTESSVRRKARRQGISLDRR
jgi:DNA-binding NarL/FixJ family response regulator